MTERVDDGRRMLDLYARFRRVLHRPGWAAVGCGLVGAGSLVSMTASAFGHFVWIFRGSIPDPWFRLRLQLLGMLGGVMLQGAAMLVLGMVDVTARAVNPWPRRIMAAAGLLADTWGGIGYFLLWGQSISPRSGVVFTDFYSAVFLPLMMLALGCSAVWSAFALAYLMQVAGWLQSRALAIGGAVMLGVMMLVTLWQCALIVVLWRFYASSPLLLWSGMSIANEAVMIARLVSYAGLAVFAIVLAVRLGRARRV